MSFTVPTKPIGGAAGTKSGTEGAGVGEPGDGSVTGLGTGVSALAVGRGSVDWLGVDVGLADFGEGVASLTCET